MSAPLVVPPAPAGHLRIRLVTDENDPLAFLIRTDTLSQVSHAEVVLRDGTIVGAYGDGVQHRPGDYDTGSTAQMFVDIPHPDVDAWETFLLGKVGTPYDYAAIAGFALHADMHTPGHTICSALVADALRHVGIVSKKQFKPDHMTSPSDLALALSYMAQMCGFTITPAQQRGQS
jgi:hypothetical protein